MRREGKRGSEASLLFPGAMSNSGFRISSLSPYNNLDPHTIVRELIQNSLDAANKRQVVHVEFHIEDVPANRIPALSQYKERLHCAIETQTKQKNIEQARSIVDAMSSASGGQHVRVLWVLDNGIGLNKDRMSALLGDGQSEKADASTAGSYGNGHMTAFPASDLRYILYGGVHGEGRTVSGHAILAAHKFEGESWGPDGYLAETIRHDLFDPFEFYSHASLLDEKLDDIKSRFGTGSAVGILGFNSFNEEDEKTIEVIENVAAAHFTPVIYDGRMEVSLDADGEKRIVNPAALKGILERSKERKRRRRHSIGPRGRQAWDTLHTLGHSHRHMIETTEWGSVQVQFRKLPPDAGGTHLQLFRNGMWITDEIPNNRPADFSTSAPFNAVILLKPEDAKKACELIRHFEGPRHADIDLRRQRPNSPARESLQGFLSEMHGHIADLAPEIEIATFDPDFFSIEVEGSGMQSDTRTPGQGTPEPVPPRPPRGGHPTNPGKRRGPSSDVPFRRQGRRIEALLTILRRPDGLRLRAKPLEDTPEAELRVLMPTGSDETCDNPEAARYLEIGEGATFNGQPLGDFVQSSEGENLAVRLGALSASEGEIDIWLPCNTAVDGNFRVELVARQSRRERRTGTR